MTENGQAPEAEGEERREEEQRSQHEVGRWVEEEAASGAVRRGQAEARVGAGPLGDGVRGVRREVSGSRVRGGQDHRSQQPDRVDPVARPGDVR